MEILSESVLPIWLAFWVIWIISAFTSKKNAPTNASRFFALRLVVVIIILSFIRRKTNLTFRPILHGNNISLIIGYLIFLAGLGLALWARFYLGRNWGMPMTLKQDQELVTNGPYRFIRHPIYTGFLLAFFGSVFASSIYWIIFFVVSATYFIYSAFVEEKNMLKSFPKVYPQYKRETKMLIPFIF